MLGLAKQIAGQSILAVCSRASDADKLTTVVQILVVVLLVTARVFMFLQYGLILGDVRLERVTVHRLVFDSRGDHGRDLTDGRGIARIEVVYGRISIPNRDARIGKHLGRGGFSHSNRTRQAKNKRFRHASTIWRRVSSTVGRIPNHASKPGTA